MANQGGSHEQHVKAGQQSHKNDDNKQQSAEGGKGSQHGGGQRGSQQGGGERGGSGSFANDREKASEAGRKGGKS